ncbi:hypothetical protein ACFXKR_38000 [Streptomyces violascens]|uniref:hypothetical protein n=1 Tax=Streptomyces violascens TaxID=67381 RepID=UPI00369DAF25
MKFQMALVPPSRPIDEAPDFELDEDYDSLVMDTCGLLAQTDCVFRVAGFGQDPWPVDVSYDLSTVIEQLPEALSALRHKEPAQIDFYGQGVERLVRIVPRGESAIVTCVSNAGWVPMPSAEELPLVEAERLLVSLARDFKAALELVCPDIAALEVFAGW